MDTTLEFCSLYNSKWMVLQFPETEVCLNWGRTQRLLQNEVEFQKFFGGTEVGGLKLWSMLTGLNQLSEAPTLGASENSEELFGQLGRQPDLSGYRPFFCAVGQRGIAELPAGLAFEQIRVASVNTARACSFG